VVELVAVVPSVESRLLCGEGENVEWSDKRPIVSGSADHCLRSRIVPSARQEDIRDEHSLMLVSQQLNSVLKNRLPQVNSLFVDNVLSGRIYIAVEQCE
jgi:hypothetical protein